MGNPILVLDFDGVIHAYDKPWAGATVIPDGPVAGAFDFIKVAVLYFDVQIYSSRSKEPGGIEAMKDWFAMQVEPGFRDRPAWVDQISFPTAKPAAFLTIDDRALTFDGTWPTMDRLLAFKPWNKR